MQEKTTVLKVVKNHQKEHQADCANKLKIISGLNSKRAVHARPTHTNIATVLLNFMKELNARNILVHEKREQKPKRRRESEKKNGIECNLNLNIRRKMCILAYGIKMEQHEIKLLLNRFAASAASVARLLHETVRLIKN